MIRYFQDIADNKHKFNMPATDTQIAVVERQLEMELPNDYKEFLKLTNGFEGRINKFIVNFCPVDKIYQSTQDACAKFFPWAIYVGSNGDVEMFVIDTRQKPYQFGLLSYIGEDEDFIILGNTFENFIDRLYKNTAFEKL